MFRTLYGGASEVRAPGARFEQPAGGTRTHTVSRKLAQHAWQAACLRVVGLAPGAHSPQAAAATAPARRALPCRPPHPLPHHNPLPPPLLRLAHRSSPPATPQAAFHLELEYGLPDGAPLAQPGVTHLQPPPPPPPRLEFDWSQSDDPAAAAARLTRAAAALVAAHARTRVRVALSVGPPPDAAPAGAGGAIVSASQWQEVAGGGAPPAPRVLLRLSYENEAPVLRGLAFTRTSGSGAASEALVAALLRALDTTTARRLKLCDGLGWAAAVWAVEPRAWAALRGLSLSGCGLASLPPAVGTLSRIKVGARVEGQGVDPAHGVQ